MPELLKRYAQFLEDLSWWVRILIITIISLYLIGLLVSFTIKLFNTVSLDISDFDHLELILHDALMLLIVLAIVRTLFINRSFDYALTFLEIGFVVILRKLILLEATPETAWVLLVLGLVSSFFFGLVLYTHYLKQDIKEE